jgi:hypothetical protein
MAARDGGPAANLRAVARRPNLLPNDPGIQLAPMNAVAAFAIDRW